MENNHGHPDLEFSMDPMGKKIIKRKVAKEIKLDELVPFKDHPFKLYEGQRLADMVHSIQANGVIVPIIVRPFTESVAENAGTGEGASSDVGVGQNQTITNNKYEILSGHNRVKAAKEAGRETVPAVVQHGLSEEEALLIVTETNLIQRSFSDLKHSERAFALTIQYEAMKMKSGYRTDLLQEIADMTSTPLGRRSETRDKLGEQHSLGRTTISRYLRINKLITPLKDRLDNDNIGMRVAETLSYLREKEQEIVEGFLANEKKISITQADTLKKESEKGELNETSIGKILEPVCSAPKVKPLKLSVKFLSQHFKENQSTEEMERVIAEALEQYFSNQ